MSAGRKPPSERDDEPTSHQRPEPPTVGNLARVTTRRGVDPDLAKTIRDHVDDDDAYPEDATTIDPEVPSGMREPARRFDPSGNEEDLRTQPRPSTNQVVIEDEAARSPLATVIGKRNPGKVKPAPPVHELALTNRWEPAQPPEDTVTNRVRAPGLPLAPGPRSESFKAVSMKTPTDPKTDTPRDKPPVRALPEVRLRAMSELSQNQTPPKGVGFLAPPYDPREARSRRRRDNAIWGSVAVMVAAVVMLAVWFLAR